MTVKLSTFCFPFIPDSWQKPYSETDCLVIFFVHDGDMMHKGRDKNIMNWEEFMMNNVLVTLKYAELEKQS